MKKLSIKEQKNVVGGYNENGCRGVQALAETYIEHGATNAQWYRWAKMYDENC